MQKKKKKFRAHLHKRTVTVNKRAIKESVAPLKFLIQLIHQVKNKTPGNLL
jgi:hypothetical protein